MKHRSSAVPDPSWRVLVASTALSILLLPVVAEGADSVTNYSLSNLPTNVDLNDFDAWAYYTDNTQPQFDPGSVDTSPTTDALNLAKFSAIATVPSGSYLAVDAESTNMTVTYAGGVGGANGAAQVGTGPHKTAGSNYYDYTIQSGLTLSTKLIAPTETLNFYVYAYNSTTDLSLSYGNHVDDLYTDSILYPGTQGNSDSYGDGNTQGELTVTVQGSIGDTFDFTISPGTNQGHVGLEAVTVDAIPEPSTYAMMLGGLTLLGFCVRRKAALLG